MSAKKLKVANVRLPARRRNAAKPAAARILSIYDGQECVGTVKVTSKGEAVAYDPGGKSLGRFPSIEIATAAFKN
jgi:hypothetical protein